jgi:hydroxyacylglutathione hydrolase
LDIYRLPAFKDNYFFLLYDSATAQAAVVDPGVAAPVLAELERLGATLVAILNTHHHWDHVDGNADLLAQFPGAVVYGGAEDRGRIPGQTVFLNGGDRVGFADRQATVYFVPGHTRGHVAYYFPPVAAEDSSGDRSGHLFCGDTIFSAGCGRLKEGTPAQMLDSLAQLRELPDDTQIWAAHEYTLSNLKFALTIDPQNADLQARFLEVQQLRQRQEPTIPTSMGLEKRTNPFLRWDTPAVQQAFSQSDPVATFAALRLAKDRA